MSAHYVSPSQLEALGIDEVEPGVCADTYANKRILREARWQWDTVFEEDGSYSGLIQAIDPDTRTARRDALWEQRKPIMVNPSDRYSEYVGPEEYPMDFPMPFWLQKRRQLWVEVQLGRRKPRDDWAHFPERCEVIRHDGTRCWLWASRPDRIKRCGYHNKVEDQKLANNALVAKHKLLEVLPDVADNLVDLAFNADTDAVRAKVSTDILAINGIRVGHEVEVTHKDESATTAAEVIAERMDRLTKAMISRAAGELSAPEPVIDAEIVETTEQQAEEAPADDSS